MWLLFDQKGYIKKSKAKKKSEKNNLVGTLWLMVRYMMTIKRSNHSPEAQLQKCYGQIDGLSNH